MSPFLLVVIALVALAVVSIAGSVMVAMQRAAGGGEAIRIEARPGRPGEEVALRLVFASTKGRSQVSALAVEGDLARALDLRPPRGFTPYETRPVRYEEFEPDLEAIASQLDDERPQTVEISHAIEKLQRAQFAAYEKQRKTIDAVQFTGALPVGAEPVELELPGHAIPEAAGRLWVTTTRRVGQATIEDVAVIDLPVEAEDELLAV